MITLEVNTIVYTSFDEIEVSTRLDAISGVFRFTAYDSAVQAFPFSVGDPCRVLVEEVPVITGFIDMIEVRYSADDHSIQVSGRDKTADIIDSTLGDKADIEAGISFQAAMKKILEVAKITGIEVIDEVDTLADFKVSERLSAEVGTTVFEFMESYARKFQVLVTTDGNGNVLLTRGERDTVDFKLSNTLGTPDLNNIKNGSVRRDHSNRFNQYIVKSEGNVSALNETGAASTDKEIIEPSDGATDEDIRATRIFYMQAEKASSTAQCKERAIWQANVNRSRAFRYTVTVEGFLNDSTGNIWRVNRIVFVDDVFAGLQDELLIDSVTYSLSLGGGSQTTLGLVTKDAYTLQASEPTVDTTPESN